ncbi:MAG: hypothetical protein Ct9H90mP30_3910 [Actinomycetota bacterium]|nr:MAG: hypothetical protein Ct9H90mP30_3910 [Actinomycetota bacterium]
MLFQEAEIFSQTDLAVSVPEFMSMIVATVTHAARESSHINQRSGVSVRVTVANYEALIAGAVRRTLLSNETEVIPRISDLSALIASTGGKIEVESLDDGREIEIIQYLIKQSILDFLKPPPTKHSAQIFSKPLLMGLSSMQVTISPQTPTCNG